MQTQRQLALAAALVSGVLIVQVELFRLSEGRGSGERWYWLPTLFNVMGVLWKSCAASFLGALAMHRGARAASEEACIGWLTFGGVVYFALRHVPSLFVPNWQAPAAWELLGNTLLSVTLGPVLGLLVGAFFLATVLSPMIARLTSPTQDAVAYAWLACARLCMVGALIAVGLKILTAPLILWAPAAVLFIAAAFCFVRARSLRRAFDRLRNELLAGTHKTLCIASHEPLADALPLTEHDRVDGEKRAITTRESSAYRQSATQLSTYVTLPSTHTTL